MKELIWGRYALWAYTGLAAAIFAGLSGLIHPYFLSGTALFIVTFGLGCYDFFQKKRGLLANYPLLGRARYILESIRPELRQYFWEADTDELPYSRNQRAMVYQRSRGILAARPLGTVLDTYAEDYSWLNHSLQPTHIENKDFRVKVGAGKQAYNCSILNISGTSFGAMSPPAIESLNTGANLGGFAHNTGEGSFSKYHSKGGGDVIWQISTGYFGCRTKSGAFDASEFEKIAKNPQIKMIEIKLSQGAKPGHGGMLMAPKVTPEIAETRGIEPYQDCISPSSHSEFSTPRQLVEFIERLRKLSGGKPVGFKLCIGHPWEFAAIAKAMVETGILADFVTVDGSEGGTGAAPVEFTDHLGCPLRDAIIFVDNTLKGAGIRNHVKIAASGKIVSAYDVVRHIALGADWCNMARPFMFALGCIQARDCASGHCPTGLATMNPNRYRVVDVAHRAKRVANFQTNTVLAVAEMLEASGLNGPHELTRRHIVRRLSESKILLADQIYPKVEDGALIRGEKVDDPRLAVYWDLVTPDSFKPIEQKG